MKPTAVVNADVLFEDHRETLKWHWAAGQSASERRFDDKAISEARSGADLVGYLNYIHPYRVQVLGSREVAYLTNASTEDCRRRVSRIVVLEPPALVVADDQVPPSELMAMCERAHIPLFTTADSAAFVIDVLRAYLSRHFADRTTLHGVFMDILGLGVLITGETLWISTVSTRPRWKGVAPTCCRTCWRCAALACSTSRPSLVKQPCAARCACA
jgi:HPr kinase/phosphorylase